MPRILSFFRHRRFAGALLTCWVVTGMSREAFLEYQRAVEKAREEPERPEPEDLDFGAVGVPVKNGRTARLEVRSGVPVSFFVTNGGAVSETVVLPPGEEDAAFEIDTVGGLWAPPALTVRQRKA